MVIVETTVFTRRVQSVLSDEQYRVLQNQLVANPAAWKSHTRKQRFAENALVCQWKREARRFADHVLLAGFERYDPNAVRVSKECARRFDARATQSLKENH